MNASFEYIKKYAALLAGQEYSPGAAAMLFLETDEGVYGTKNGADLANLTENDIERMPLETLPKGRRGIRAAVVSQTPACQKWLRRGEALIPSLDDMAQIIGTRAAVIDGREDPKKMTLKLAYPLQTNAACFVITGRDENGDFRGYTLTVGRTLYEAIVAMTVLEKSAEVTLLTEKLGGACNIAAWERKLMRVVYMKKYSKAEEKAKADEAETAGVRENPEVSKLAENREDSKEAPETSESDAVSAEKRLRELLVEYGKKLVLTGLVQGTWGNLSVRLDDTHMLATPSGLDYMRLTPSDMVKVNIGNLEYEGDLKPTSEKGLHAAIYQKRPDVCAIIHTHAKYCSVFAAAHKDLSATGSASFSDPVKLAAYALPGTKTLMKNTAAAVGKNNGAIMANHGMIVCGEDIEAAFKNACELEEIARSALGK